jgi:hypothetical protein
MSRLSQPLSTKQQLDKHNTMKKKMIIEALLHTLIPTYGNENVYHPDGSAIPVADLVARFCQPDNPPTPPTIKVYSSHGFLLVDRSTGDVIDR